MALGKEICVLCLLAHRRCGPLYKCDLTLLYLRCETQLWTHEAVKIQMLIQLGGLSLSPQTHPPPLSLPHRHTD